MALDQFRAMRSGGRLLRRSTVINELEAALALSPICPTSGVSGVDLIASERRRQIEHHGFNAGHDDCHENEELACAAAWYAMPHWARKDADDKRLILWPDGWGEWQKSRSDERVRDLEKAGALIAAEIERLKRLEILRGGGVA